MNESKFYDTLLQLYGRLQIPPRYQELGKLGKYISWYFADHEQQLISIDSQPNQHVIELDISSAFPVICHALFDPNSEFIKHLDNISNKKEKNIYIATTLKNTGYLNQLNTICKLIVMGVLFNIDNSDEILILELKKDGCVICCSTEVKNKIYNLNNIDNEFLNYISQYNFNFHTNKHDVYIRSHKTSIFGSTEGIKIKGIYKHRPKKLLEMTENYLIKQKEFDEEYIKYIYSKHIWDIIRLNGLKEHLENFYLCNGRKVLSSAGKYETISMSNNVDPRLYLKIFVFPLLISRRIEL